MTQLTVKDLLGDWHLTGEFVGQPIDILFNSRCNAELVKRVLEWEAEHPNMAIPYAAG